jgi:putative transposase
MALSRSALAERLEASRADDGADLIRESLRVALQELIEAEATERIGKLSRPADCVSRCFTLAS